MSIPTSVYLKGYYGHQNLGDEILLFGVLQYLRDNQSIKYVTIECDDQIDWMEQRMIQHGSLIENIDYTLVKRPSRRQQIKNTRNSLT